jgi:uncharacterized protein (DUF2235 family)
MPDKNGNDGGRSLTGVSPVEEVVEKVRQPETPAERRKRRHEAALTESDEDRSKRRHVELHSHKEAHNVHIAEAHANHPVPLDVKFENLTEDQQRDWNARSAVIASANRAYHLAVRTTFEEHQAEDAHIQRTRNEAAKKAQEAV